MGNAFLPARFCLYYGHGCVPLATSPKSRKKAVVGLSSSTRRFVCAARVDRPAICLRLQSAHALLDPATGSLDFRHLSDRDGATDPLARALVSWAEPLGHRDP